VIRFGPAGLGSVKEAISNLEDYAKRGFKACEIAFTYGAYIKKQEDAEMIGKRAKELGIRLSIHGQYWINLNSDDNEKIIKSKERILECLKVGTWLGVACVVFHPGFYGKISKEETYENIKNNIKEILMEAKAKEYTPKVAPEMMGKVNVFGSVSEIFKLVDDTGCSFCIDFAHILAREKKVDYKELFLMMKKFDDIHVHFSGIEYGEKGEKRHLQTPDSELKKLLENLPKNKDVTIINESPVMIEDTEKAIKMYSKIK
jgi:deoxyribonuclease-4